MADDSTAEEAPPTEAELTAAWRHSYDSKPPNEAVLKSYPESPPENRSRVWKGSRAGTASLATAYALEDHPWERETVTTLHVESDEDPSILLISLGAFSIRDTIHYVAAVETRGFELSEPDRLVWFVHLNARGDILYKQRITQHGFRIPMRKIFRRSGDQILVRLEGLNVDHGSTADAEEPSDESEARARWLEYHPAERRLSAAQKYEVALVQEEVEQMEDGLFPSPGSDAVIEMSRYHLTLRHPGEQRAQKIVSRGRGPFWDFRNGAWSPHGERFFADNSGAQACIWEVDPERRTVTKIVPEHQALLPAPFMHDGRLHVAYADDGRIRVAVEPDDWPGARAPAESETRSMRTPRLRTLPVDSLSIN